MHAANLDGIWRHSQASHGGVSRAAKGADCKSAGAAFVGSSPTSPTNRKAEYRGQGSESGQSCSDARIRVPFLGCGCSSMVEQQPSKLMTRVRFPSPAPLRGWNAAIATLANGPSIMHIHAAAGRRVRRDRFRRSVAQLARAPVSKTGGWGFESLHSCQAPKIRRRARNLESRRRYRKLQEHPTRETRLWRFSLARGTSR